jgi:hypothetical protein
MKTFLSTFVAISFFALSSHASSLLGGYSCTSKKGGIEISGNLYIGSNKLVAISIYQTHIHSNPEKVYSLYSGDAQSTSYADFEETGSIYRTMQYYSSFVSINKKNVQLIGEKKTFELSVITTEGASSTKYVCNR